ncbi:MAG: hypothetical protein ACRC35_14525 [Angustibacter sp.]
MDGPLPTVGHWTLATTFTAGPDGPIDQVGFKTLDNRTAAMWSFDMSDGAGQRNYQDADIRSVGNRWTLTMPRDAVRSASGQWSARLDVDGHDGRRGVRHLLARDLVLDVPLAMPVDHDVVAITAGRLTV